ncbi:1-acyl-sn-glycerol-3-phosphate acyltransferase [Ornithobacterium rhinotracheale]|uniref:lysophospholipid acyltransferase family protein n=1 Tax=Ornithobacterium rhinotracheale TaxID=28251 RepID=UPI001FBB8C3F|nr:lysophospholipid acyltransferase family protein [Ornithobacterium rhinotracheale]MRJ08545.1 1-acyl-sn-glycerol-3-phosphate acyltransferase [Ornithobacterium rhinotracheale]UOH76817.1 1-acyl-sn-glycerol-3-phosphate acyltransferase [Ornithobacterium rhinotracheale]
MNHKKNIFFDAFGYPHFIKRFIIFTFGAISYRRYNGFNKLKIQGTENIANLPEQNVLFVSNHQTYFADVSAMYHVFSSVKNGFQNSIKNPIYLLNPKIDMYYVAAKETMNKGLLAKLFSLAGAVTVKRTWREAGKDIKRKVDLKEIDNIEKALQQGWVITFPQGTTKAFAPGRKGTAHIIKKNKPIVVPVVIDGFRRSFDKKGLLIKKRGVEQTMTFKKPLEIDYENDSTQKIIDQVMDAIEQSEKYIKVKPIPEEGEAEN